MSTVRGQQHSFSTHERMFQWKCKIFKTENVSTWGGYSYDMYIYSLNIYVYIYIHVLNSVHHFNAEELYQHSQVPSFYEIWLAILNDTIWSCKARIILGMGMANERRCYNVTPSLIGWAHTKSDPSNSNQKTWYLDIHCKQKVVNWQCCHQWWHGELSFRQLAVPPAWPVTTMLSIWHPFVFRVHEKRTCLTLYSVLCLLMAKRLNVWGPNYSGSA